MRSTGRTSGCGCGVSSTACPTCWPPAPMTPWPPSTGGSAGFAPWSASCPSRPGLAGRPAPECTGCGSTTGRAWSCWPGSTRPGPAGCWLAAASPRALRSLPSWPSTSAPDPPTRPSSSWSPWPADAGGSRSASRRPRTRPDWPPTRSATTPPGTATSPWPCSPTPTCPPPARPRKERRRSRNRPAHRADRARAAAPARHPHPHSATRPRPHRGLVVVAPTTPGPGPRRPLPEPRTGTAITAVAVLDDLPTQPRPTPTWPDTPHPRSTSATPSGSTAARSAHHDNRTLRVGDEVLADRAEQHPGEAAVPPGADNHQVGTLGALDQHLCRAALLDRGPHVDLRCSLLQPGDQPVEHAERLELRLALVVLLRQRPVGRRLRQRGRMPGHHNRQGGTVVRRLVVGPLQRPSAFVGAVHSGDDEFDIAHVR